MSLNAASIAVMVAKGLTGADILAVAEALEAKKDRTGAERQARYRDRHKVTRDVTRDVVSLNEDILNPSGTVLPNEASASLPIRQPISEAWDCWNENAAKAGWPIANTKSATRQRSVSARLREHGLDGWKNAVAKARASPFLAGADPPSWFTFNWLIKSENFLKLIEGNYDQAHRGSGGSMGRPRADPTLELVRAATAAQRPPTGDHGQARFTLPTRKLG